MLLFSSSVKQNRLFLTELSWHMYGTDSQGTLNLLQILSVLPLCRRGRFPGHYWDQAIYVVQFHQNYQLVPDWDKVRHHRPQYTTRNNEINFLSIPALNPSVSIRWIARIPLIGWNDLLLRSTSSMYLKILTFTIVRTGCFLFCFGKIV
jgi:hypothetical protein